jgi:hypothetical protein
MALVYPWWMWPAASAIVGGFAGAIIENWRCTRVYSLDAQMSKSHYEIPFCKDHVATEMVNSLRCTNPRYNVLHVLRDETQRHVRKFDKIFDIYTVSIWNSRIGYAFSPPDSILYWHIDPKDGTITETN